MIARLLALLGLRVAFAEGCAWRGVYLYRDDHQVARLVLDPAPHAPTLSGLFAGAEWRVQLPHVSWAEVAESEYAPEVLAVYRAEQWLLHRLDGRYGWGSRR